MPDSIFDGVSAPQLIVEIGWSYAAGGSGIETGFILGVGQLDITSFAPAEIWTQCEDFEAISISRGKERITDDTGPGSCTVTLCNEDGTYDPNNPNGPLFAGSQILPMRQLRVRAVWNGVSYGLFQGRIDDYDYDFGNDPTCTLTCSDMLSRLAQHNVPAQAASFAGDSTGARINRVLDIISWPAGLRNIATGNYFMAGTEYGDSILGLMNAAQLVDQGTLFITGSGVVTFYDGRAQYERTSSLVPQLILSDTMNDSRDGLLFTSIDVEYGGSQIINDWTVTRIDFADPETAVAQNANDATSVATYTKRSESLTEVGLQTDLQALYLAQARLLETRNPQFRVRSVAVDLLGQGNFTPQFTDTCTRTVVDGLGTSDSGHVYSLTGTASEYDVDGAEIDITHPTAAIDHIGYYTLGSPVADQTWTFSSGVTAAGGSISVRNLVRMTDASNYYSVQLDFLTTGTVQYRIVKNVAASVIVIGDTINIGAYSPGTKFKTRVAVYGSVIRAKAWLATDNEPDWGLTIVDSDLTTGSLAGFLTRRQSGNTNTNAVVSIDNGVAHTQVDLWQDMLELDMMDRLRAVRNYTDAYTFDRELLLIGINHEITNDRWSATLKTADPSVQDGFILDQSAFGSTDVLVY